MKGHFLAIEGFLKSQQYNALEKYLEELTDEAFNMEYQVKPHGLVKPLFRKKLKEIWVHESEKSASFLLSCTYLAILL
ncbi:MAG: hypothetical protein RR841_09690 [Eubacterium sp.]